MGQSPLQCEAKPGTPRDLFSQQLSIYQWRADPNHNSCVARVFFKNAYTQKQEQKFAEFLQQQQQEDYLELYRFKQEVEDFRKLSSEEVIVFEKYVCHVGHLSSLPLEDSLYLLQILLCGFQELRKIFDRIVVQENCCFVTHEGEVRVWINPNPKSNQIWAGTDDQLPRQVNIRTILAKIVTIAQRTSLPSPKSDQFFRIISNMLSPSFKHCYYADLRRVINQFCYLNNIQMSKNLHHLLRRTPTQTEYRRSYKRDQRNTETSNPSVREKLIYLPTAQSESNLHLNKSLLLKSKSLQNQSQGPLIRQSTLLRQTSDYPMPHTLPTVSQIVQCERPVQPRQSNSQCPQMVRNSGIIKTSVLKASRDFKKSSFLENQILEVDSKSSHNKQASSKHHQPPQHLLQVATNIQAKRTSKTEKNKKARQTASKEMLVSIMQNLPKNSQNFPPGSHMQHHRTHMDRYSTESKQEDMYWSRPWITTKTITKLISEHDQSLQNSIAESSDYYNDSVYSGALTHMGRDITPPNADRSKTVRISRDR